MLILRRPILGGSRSVLFRLNSPWTSKDRIISASFLYLPDVGCRVAPVTQHGITYFVFRWNYVLCDWGGSVILVSSFDVGRLIHNKGWLLALRLFFLASNASLIMEKSKCRRLLFVWFGRTLDETDNSTTEFLFHRFDESWPYQWFWFSAGVGLELSSESLDITTFSSSFLIL